MNQHTLSSSLPLKSGFQYEKETIHNSYKTGSYSSIKQLPSVLKPGEIQFNRRDIAVTNFMSSSNEAYRPPAAKSDYFHKPHYVCSDYDMEKVNTQWVRDEEKLKIDSNSRKPFKVSARVRQKTEDIFYDPEYKFPHLGPGGGNISLHSITRSDLNDSTKYLYGHFYIKIAPSMAEVREKARIWSTEIYKQLCRDWPQYIFKVKFSKRHEFLVMFEEPPEGESDVIFPPPNNVLNRYMNQMAKHGLAFEYKLRRRGDRWNVLEREEPPDLDLSDEGSNKGSVGLSVGNDIDGRIDVSQTGSTRLLDGTSAEFSRSTFIVSERDDEDDNVQETVQPRPLQEAPEGRVNSTGKVCLVYAFFAPWVNISAAQTVKHTAEKNRKEAKEFAEKLKREKYLLY